MVQQLINLGNAPNDGTGDPLRVGGDKINDNFTELYNQDVALTAAIASIILDAVPQGYGVGCTLSNNAGDATNDIDVAAGTWRDSTALKTIVLAASITKRLDAAWVVGTGNGGLDTGAIADTTYHVYLIKRLDTNVVDVIFSASATAPTLPSPYTVFRRIGSIIRSSGAIRAFTQVGDEFLLTTPVSDVAVTNLSTSSTSYTITTPLGIKTVALLEGYYAHATISNGVYVRSLDQADVACSLANVTALTPVGSATVYIGWTKNIRTNTSGQIGARASAASSTFGVQTCGWLDTRGRL